MQKLNLPEFNLKIQDREDGKFVFDEVRRKYVLLTPEEWVRQQFVQYLCINKKCPKSLLSVEKQLKLNNLQKRYDIVVHNNYGNPVLLVECKAPSISINQETFDQVARYNIVLKVKYLVVTNGLRHFCCEINYEEKTYRFLHEIPDYKNITD